MVVSIITCFSLLWEKDSFLIDFEQVGSYMADVISYMTNTRKTIENCLSFTSAETICPSLSARHFTTYKPRPTPSSLFLYPYEFHHKLPV